MIADAPTRQELWVASAATSVCMHQLQGEDNTIAEWGEQPVKQGRWRAG